MDSLELVEGLEHLPVIIHESHFSVDIVHRKRKEYPVDANQLAKLSSGQQRNNL